MLRVEDLCVEYGGVVAVDGLSFEVSRSETLGLIGPNGAGKSSAINAIAGMIRPTSGAVWVEGTEITQLPARRRLRYGLTRTFQQAQLAGGMTVEQNLVLPLLPSGRKVASARAREVATRVGISDLLSESAAELPYGSRRLVEVARALMSRPKIVLLDEPAAGLTRADRERLAEVIAELNTDGVSAVMVDHDVQFVMSVCERLVVLDAGSVIAAGDAASVRSNRAVVEAYLGRSG
jgi:branched-chain amino acid transport system ATP-binding protein